MADDIKGSFFGSITPQQVLAVLTLVSSAVLMQIQPLQSRREWEVADKASAVGDDHKFFASHIEDPLMALKAQKVVDPSATDFDPSKQVQASSHWGFYQQVEEQTSWRRRVQVMCVLMRPGTDMAAREQRHRERLAVVSALATAGYVPVSSRRMEVCRLKDVVGANKEGFTTEWNLGKDSMDVPFEWFQPTGALPGVVKKRFSRVCVLWFDMEAVTGRTGSPKPLDRLRRILNALLTGHPRPVAEAIRKDGEIDPTLVEATVLGPHDSGTLAVMAGEAQTALEGRPPAAGRWEQPLVMASPYATSSAEALMRTAGKLHKSTASDGREGERRAREEELESWMNAALRGRDSAAKDLFLRTPLTDDHVAEALVDELKRRGVRFATSAGNDETEQGDIVLVSEFDTSYGRELPLGFLDAAGVEDATEVLNQPGSRWHWITFARGLDGRYGAVANDSSGRGDAPDGRKAAVGDEPRGTNQTDSLRRLAEQLLELHESRQRAGKPGIVALGVLGGDVYDKLLMFRALRPLLENTLFFTNDLEAWLWDAQELRTTRNVIVASPFGLRLGERWQAGKPPFRDSYQTSAYAAALALAAGPNAPELASQLHGTGERKHEARLFEIGRQLPVDMSLETPENGVKREDRLHPEPETQQPFWTKFARLWRATLLMALSALCFGAWYVISNMPDVWMGGASRPAQHLKGFARAKLPVGLRECTNSLAKYPAWIVIAVLVAQLVAYICWLLQRQKGSGEVFLLQAGVSSWPFFVINLVAVLVAVLLMVRALVILHQGRENLDKQYFEGEKEAGSGNDAWLSRLLLNWDKSQLVMTEKGSQEPMLKITKLWHAFRGSSAAEVRLARSGLVTFFIIIAFWLVSDLSPQPNMPVRGEMARTLFWWAEKLSLIAFVWLSVLIFDSLWLNRIFIDWFGRGASNWRQEAVARHAQAGAGAKHVCDFIDLRLIADWTRDMGRLTALPFFILALLLVARLNYFDAWHWPVHLGVTFGFLVLLVIVAAYRAHAAAERLRRKTLRDLNALPADEAAQQLAGQISSLSHGAFMPFLKQPVMEAVYWLISALSVTGLWQAISQLLA